MTGVLRVLFLLGLLGCRPDPVLAPGPDPARLEHEVRVLTDGVGMPHVYGATLDDVVFMQGYLTARDRMAQLDL